MRHAVVAHLNIGPLAQRALSPGITWDGWTVPIWLSLVFILAMGLIMMSIAIVTFSKTE
jgi:ABC-2 type transport system permease protein